MTQPKSKVTIRDFINRYDELYGPVSKLLANRQIRPDLIANCLRKKRYSFNTASEIATDFWEQGHFGMEPYFCLFCHRFHVGHGMSSKSHRYICPWCGNRIRSSRLHKHAAKCGRLIEYK